jgi:hypothetical protein
MGFNPARVRVDSATSFRQVMSINQNTNTNEPSQAGMQLAKETYHENE